MATLQEILARAQALREETALGSISPERAGSIMYDTLQQINQMQLEGGSLVINKIYASVSAMEADDAPVSDLTGQDLRQGQLVVIVPSDTSSSDLGSVYRYNGTTGGASSWSFTGKIGGYPMDQTPTQGSTRAVTSGGVYEQITQLGQEVVKKKGYGNGNLLDPDKFTEGYAIFASSGNISGGRTGFLVTDYIPVNGKDIISNALFNSTWGGAVYDSSKSLLRPLTTSQYTYTSGDAYIRLTFQTSTANKKAFYGTLLKPFSEFDPIAEYYEKDSASILNAVTPLDVLPIWASGYMVNPNNGNLLVDQYSYYTDYIKVSPGKRVKTNIVIGGNRGVAFYNESGGYVSGINTYANGEFSVPAGAYYMRMTTTDSSYNAGVFVRICGWIDEAINKNLDSINALEKAVTQIDVIADWIQGKMINLSNGNKVTDSGSYCTDFIQTEDGKTYATNVVIGGNRSIGFYNSSKSFISGINSLTNGQFTTPAGTAYMRVSTTSSSYSAGVYIREIGWISNGIAKNAGDISNIQNVLASVKIATSWEAGKFINYSTGYIDSSASYALSDYIKVTAGKSYRTNIRFNGNAGACFYNANKVKVGGVNAFDEVVVENGVTLYSIISIPDGASYIRSSHYLSSGIATTAIFFQEVDGIDYNCSNNKEASIVALDMMRDVIVQSVEANPYKFVPTDKSYIAFTFDDGEASNSDMVDLFHQKGVPLCLAIPRQRLKTMCLNGKTIAENCLAVEADGGEILTHSLTYMDANSTEDDIRAFFEWNKAGLLAAGLHPWGVVNAGGGAELGSVPNLEWLKRYAYSTHEYGLFFTALTDNVHFNFVRHGLGSRLSVLEDFVDEQIAQHNPIIFNAHAPYDVDPDNLDGGWVQKVSDLIDYITTNYTSSDYEFCNIRTWMRKHQKTAAQLYFDSL